MHQRLPRSCANCRATSSKQDRKRRAADVKERSRRTTVETVVSGRPAATVGIFVGNSAHAILTTHGGFVELLVKLNEKVTAGQKVAIQRNTFGEVVAEYTSGVAGEVAGYRTDATAEPGIPLVMMLYQSAARENPEDYSE